MADTTIHSQPTEQSSSPSRNLKQLHPKAKWLFFLQYIFLLAFFFGLIWLWTIPTIFIGIVGTLIFKKAEFSIIAIGFPLIVFLLTIYLPYLLAKLAYKNWRYEITNDALRIEKGIIWKRYVSIPYERIQNVDILRGILTRLLGLSDLHIQTAGISGSEGFSLSFSSEGRLPRLGIDDAENIRNELIKRAKGKQGV